LAVPADRVDDVVVMDFDEFQEFVAGTESFDLEKACGGLGWLLNAAGINDNEVLFGEVMEEASISDVPLFSKSAEPSLIAKQPLTRLLPLEPESFRDQPPQRREFQ
jgi:hypothetical protein